MSSFYGTVRPGCRTYVGLLVAALTAAGCATPQQQLSSIRAEKMTLLATIDEQKAELTSLREHSAKLEARLATSEKQIARLDPSARIRPEAEATEAALAWRTHQPPAEPKGTQRR